MTSPARPLRLVVLISGGGRTLLNLQHEILAGRLPAEIALVIATRPDLPGVSRARAAGLPVAIFRPAEFPSAPAFEAALQRRLLGEQPDLVILAGYLRKLAIPAALVGRVLNIHPSLLPKHGGRGLYGEHVHAAVLAAGDRESGCTVHVVDEEYDHGPVVAQTRVPVLADDTVATLAARVFAAECTTYPRAIADYGQRLRQSQPV
ncbi:MAG: phosphoribosylglycinamide formyltransferase [Planctomycetota bacterium]